MSPPLSSRAERIAAEPESVDYIVGLVFGANINADVEMQKMERSIGTYAAGNATLKIPLSSCKLSVMEAPAAIF